MVSNSYVKERPEQLPGCREKHRHNLGPLEGRSCNCFCRSKSRVAYTGMFGLVFLHSFGNAIADLFIDVAPVLESPLQNRLGYAIFQVTGHV